MVFRRLDGSVGSVVLTHDEVLCTVLVQKFRILTCSWITFVDVLTLNGDRTCKV
jgi:hypothetical protein